MNDHPKVGVYTVVTILLAVLIAALGCMTTLAQTVQHTRLVPCACEIKNTVCLTDRQMAKHATHVEMEPDRMGNHSNYEGVAVFQIGFDEKGRVTGAEALSGDPLGISRLMAAISKWTFRPVVESGRKKKGCGKISINFAMKENVPFAKVGNAH